MPPPPRCSRGVATIILSVAFFPLWFPLWAFAVVIAAQCDRTKEWGEKLQAKFHPYRYGGFTLIELSIVLIIIGLVVGGVLVGQDLIKASEVRATITQVEKYQTAANTFYGKYGYLPGDIPAGPAAQFGFAARGQYTGEGDGNGLLQGVRVNAVSSYGPYVATGENAMFWVDLSAAHMIDGSFTAASSTNAPASDIPQSGVANYMPSAKIGRGNYLFVYTGIPGQGNGLSTVGTNNFELAGMNGITQYGVPEAYSALTVREAYSIDKKIDDGMPLTGRVITFGFVEDDETSAQDIYPNGVGGSANTLATPGSSTTSFDDNNNTANPMTYSITQNNGAGVNCLLSFRMQSGD